MMAISAVTKYETFYTEHSASASISPMTRNQEMGNFPPPWPALMMVCWWGLRRSGLGNVSNYTGGRGTETHLTSAHPDAETNANKDPKIPFHLGCDKESITTTNVLAQESK